MGTIASADPLEQPMLPGLDTEMMTPDEETGVEEFLEEMSRFLQEAFYQYDSSTLRRERLKTVQESRKAYRQKTEETSWPWEGASNMVTPLTRVAVDEIEPRLVTSLVGRQPYLRIQHRPGASRKEEAQLVEDYVNYVFEEETKLFVVTSKMIHKTLLDGTVFPLVHWVKTDSPPFDGPKIELVSMEFVWMADDIDEEDWEDATVFRYVDEFTEEQLLTKAQQEDGWFVENLRGISTSDVSEVQTTEQELQDVSRQAVEETVKTLEAYFTMEGIRWIALVDKDSFKILRLRPQQQVFSANVKPLRRFCIIREEGVSWGDPIYEVVRGVQEGVDAMWNRCVNSADICTTPWGFYKKGLSGGQSRLRVFPGALFASDDPSAYVFPNLTGFKPTEFVPLIQIYQTFWQRLTTSDYMQGMESQLTGKKGSTATGTLAILQEGKIKHEYRGTVLQYSFLDLMVVVYNFITDNMPQADVLPVTGQPVLQVSLSYSYQFGLGPSSVTANRFVDRKETEDFMMVMQPFMSLLNPMALLNDILRAYGKRPEDYIDPELNQIVQQYLAIKENTKQLVALGIPEPVAKQLSQQGVTPDNVEDFMQKIGEAHGEAAAAGAIGGPAEMGQGAPGPIA